MLVHKGGKIKNLGEECKDFTPTKLQCQNIQRALQVFFNKKKKKTSIKLDLMFMKHYAPNRCLYIKVAKFRTGVGSAETSYLQNFSVKLFKEHFKVQICIL